MDGGMLGRALSRGAVVLGIAVIIAISVWAIHLTRVSAEADGTPVSAPAVAAPASGELDTGADQAAGTSDGHPAMRVQVDGAWSDRISAATGIPRRALEAYAAAELVVASEQPECGIGWNTLAAVGAIESDHGRHGGAGLSDEGYPWPAIRGPQLDGNGNAAIGDTDDGAWDGDREWDRAVGPMQFIPDTWSRWGADGNSDGARDPNQIDDATLAAARYLCHSGSMASAEGWRTAIFSYNHLDSYVNDVAAVANSYASAAG